VVNKAPPGEVAEEEEELEEELEEAAEEAAEEELEEAAEEGLGKAGHQAPAPAPPFSYEALLVAERPASCPQAQHLAIEIIRHYYKHPLSLL
jgi:hypothetical protein